MAKIDVTPEELLQMIGKQQIIIEKQSTALEQLSDMFNKKSQECDELQTKLADATGENLKLVK
jgi:hypothetical protein